MKRVTTCEAIALSPKQRFLIAEYLWILWTIEEKNDRFIGEFMHWISMTYTSALLFLFEVTTKQIN